MSFLDVIAGNPTRTVDVNQIIDALNGSVASQINLLAPASNAYALAGLMPSAPGGDQAVIEAVVSGDTFDRISMYFRGSDHYGGIRGGLGTSITAHLYAQSGGWKIDENLTIAGGLTVAGGSTFAGVTASSLSVSGTSSLAGVTASSLSVGGATAIVEGGHSASVPTLSIGDGAPGALNANEVYVQRS